jgi:hypothetical protein
LIASRSLPICSANRNHPAGRHFARSSTRLWSHPSVCVRSSTCDIDSPALILPGTAWRPKRDAFAAPPPGTAARSRSYRRHPAHAPRRRIPARSAAGHESRGLKRFSRQHPQLAEALVVRNRLLDRRPPRREPDATMQQQLASISAGHTRSWRSPCSSPLPPAVDSRKDSSCSSCRAL